ncbi:MAG: hypothetical protein VXV96_07045 [Bdellovibrionota bacterium]|jgi:hypothetical protein|nr:hypothetical protein [Bdellovibrionota bacterium]
MALQSLIGLLSAGIVLGLTAVQLAKTSKDKRKKATVPVRVKR